MNGQVVPLAQSSSVCRYTIYSSQPGCCCLCYKKLLYSQDCDRAYTHLKGYLTPDDTRCLPTYKVSLRIFSQEPNRSLACLGITLTMEVQVYKSSELRISDALNILEQYIEGKIAPQKKTSGWARFVYMLSSCC